MTNVQRKHHKNNLGLMALEPRWMFDGAAAVDAAHAAPSAAAKALIPDAPAPVEVKAADPSKDSGKKEVAFIDSSVPDYQTLTAGIRAGVAVEVIDGGQSGLAQIATWAETHSGYDAIHVISHGSEASLRIGTDTVTSATLDTAVGQAEMAALGSALRAGGDLLLYGCDVAAGADGARFIAGIAAATGADDAATNNPTGAADLGGDWRLEITSGPVEATVAVTGATQASYHNILDTGIPQPYYKNDDGVVDASQEARIDAEVGLSL